MGSIALVAVAFAACVGVVMAFREPPAPPPLPGPSPIADLTDGDVAAAAGTAEATDFPLTSPIADARCIAYRLRIKRVGADDWLIAEDRCVTLSITDDSGRAAIDPRDLILQIHGEDSDVRSGTTTMSRNPKLAAVLEARLSAEALEALRGVPLFFREQRAARPGHALVHGRIDIDLDPSPAATQGYRGRASIPVFRASPDQPLTVVLTIAEAARG